MPKIVDIDSERQNILLGFQRCALSTPFNEVSVRDIAASAGISHSKIFNYYRNKDEIIIAYARYIADKYSQAFESVVAQVSGDPGNQKELLQNLIRKLYEIDSDNSIERLCAQIYILGQYDDHMKQVVMEAFDKWRHSLRRMLQKYFSNVSESQVRAVLILVEGISIYRMNDELPIEDAMKILDDLF